MVPLTLKLQNFLAYQEAELDFRGFHLAVLIGENGAGKSTLLDAITWALWGRARVNSDDALIHLGFTDMEVEYTFGLQGNTHRVIRKRSKKGRGRSDLSLQVESGNGWHILTESNIKATQTKINQLMRLDYETFINSVFLLQGRADEFTTKSPGERKKILCDILGLSVYEIYEGRAKKRANESDKQVTIVEAKIKQIEEELTHQLQYQTELVASEQDVEKLSQQLQVVEKEQQELYEQHRAISDKQRQLNELRSRLGHDETNLAHMRETIAALQTKIKQYQTILGQESQIEQGLTELKQAQELVVDWERRLLEMSGLQNQRHALERELDAAKAKIEADLRGVTTTVNHLSPKVANIDAQQTQLAELEIQVNDLKILEQERTIQQNKYTELDKEIARLDEQRKKFEHEGKELKAKLAELQKAGSHCPVCKTPLNERHRAEAAAQFEHDIETKRADYQIIQKHEKELGKQKTVLKSDLDESSQKLIPLTQLQSRIAMLKQSLNEAQQATVQLAESQTQQIALKNQLVQQTFAQTTRAELGEVQNVLAALNYHREAHQQAKVTVQKLAHFEAKERTLGEVKQRLPEETANFEKEQNRLNRLEEQTATDRQKIAELEKETGQLPILSQRLAKANGEVAQWQRDERIARDKVAAAKQRLSYLVTLSNRRTEHEQELQKARYELGIYRELQVAFGKKGVQALLIESAIPEIELEANQLLGRMTDGRMNLRFETHREAKTGDNVIETLDIRIADELGTRDYDLFSGGEAFRINFAIRVAISKVLARRAGAQLQTLIIDEGFSSQDGAGRERMVEAINIIQHDFQKVIVITHLDELKDAFQTRIEVQKMEGGSRVTVR